MPPRARAHAHRAGEMVTLLGGTSLKIGNLF